MADLLVIENDPDDHPGRLGEWLAAAGLRLVVVRPHAGQEIPTDPTRYAGLVVLGGRQRAFPDPTGTPGAPWFPDTESLLRAAVRERVPTLAICLGAQLLATAHGGRVAPAADGPAPGPAADGPEHGPAADGPERGPAADGPEPGPEPGTALGPELGPALVARRDAAETDPLFAAVPFTPDVLQWHQDVVTELPPGAVLLAASTRYPHQAFRLGSAWGLQFHIEPDLAMVAGWAAADRDRLRRLGLDEADLLAATETVLADLADVWQPFVARFAALARGELAGIRPELPILDS